MLSDERLSLYLDGDLTDDERTEIDALLAVDEDARERLAGLESVRALLREMPLEGPGRDLWSEIVHEVTRKRWWQLPRIQLGAVALVVIAFVPTETNVEPGAEVLTEAGFEEMPVEELEREVEGQIGEARAIYASAIEMLERRADRYVDGLPDEARMELKTSLFEVEQAIARVEAVIHDNPNDASAHTTLVALYDQKLRALRSTIDVAESLLGEKRD
ncbi:MAG: hypothetical protein AAF658_18735 [Myxococcota bacterium]